MYLCGPLLLESPNPIITNIHQGVSAINLYDHFIIFFFFTSFITRRIDNHKINSIYKTILICYNAGAVRFTPAEKCARHPSVIEAGRVPLLLPASQTRDHLAGCRDSRASRRRRDQDDCQAPKRCGTHQLDAPSRTKTGQAFLFPISFTSFEFKGLSVSPTLRNYYIMVTQVCPLALCTMLRKYLCAYLYLRQ